MCSDRLGGVVRKRRQLVVFFEDVCREFFSMPLDNTTTTSSSSSSYLIASLSTTMARKCRTQWHYSTCSLLANPFISNIASTARVRLFIDDDVSYTHYLRMQALRSATGDADLEDELLQAEQLEQRLFCYPFLLAESDAYAPRWVHIRVDAGPVLAFYQQCTIWAKNLLTPAAAAPAAATTTSTSSSTSTTSSDESTIAPPSPDYIPSSTTATTTSSDSHLTSPERFTHKVSLNGVIFLGVVASCFAGYASFATAALAGLKV